MPEIQIHGETAMFEEADQIDVADDIAQYSFVTDDPAPGGTLLIRSVDPKDLPTFDGPLFMMDVDEAEDLIILKQVQMFFWPWEDDEEFEDTDEDDEEETT